MDKDSDYSYEEHDDAVPSPPRRKRERGVRETTEAILSGRSDGFSSEESEYTEDDGSSVGENGQRSPLKRSADDTATHRPFKRKRADLNFGYLELLNKEIEDAAQRTSFGDLADLPPSQIGLTYWSAFEKKNFFEAVARLGRLDLPGITAKIGSKSIAEVSHYLNFLQDAHNLRRKLETRSFLEPAEYPAAVELSQQCCHAQEEAADEISLKQEAREEQREQNRWGDIWDVTPKVARKLGRDIQDANNTPQPPPFARLFHLSRWLELSGRMFMNSSIPGNNWKFVDDDPPSVWATAFEDFHSLAVSITRRLVQTTLFMAMSRIRSKDAVGGRIRDMVQLQDAEAAIASLGMVANSNDRWIKSARRLRLDVYEDPPEGEDEHDEEPMTYDEVERDLSGEQVSDSSAPPKSSFTTQQPTSEDEESGTVEVFSDDSRSPSPLDGEEQEIKREADEVFVYSAADTRNDRHAREALKACIAMERQKEQHAGECDEYASYKAEAEMWNVLQKKPPMELPKRQDPGPPGRSNLDVESIYPGGRDWMRKLQYYSEWETLPKQGQDDTEE